MDEPSPNGANGAGRGANGRFAKGNAGGPGNPYAKKVGQLRAALMRSMTRKDWHAIVDKLIEQAKAGESWAIREVFDRTLGRPVEADLLERLEALEEAALRREGSRQP